MSLIVHKCICPETDFFCEITQEIFLKAQVPGTKMKFIAVEK